MEPGAYNICIYQGQTYEKIFVWNSINCCGGTYGANPSPVDVTGYNAQMQVKPFPLSTTILYDATANLTVGTTDGTITLLIPSAITESFTWFGSAVYDLFMISPTGAVTALLRGTFTVMPSITVPVLGQLIITDGGDALQTDSGQNIFTSNP